jgi:hypothetical protein
MRIAEELGYVKSESGLGFESLSEILALTPRYHETVTAHYSGQLLSVEEFILNSHYLGAIGKSVYPVWMDALKEMFLGYYPEVLLTGSIGSGKTTCAELAVIYMFYELCMLSDPQSTFGLMPGSEIVLVCFNRDKRLARDVTYGGVKRKMQTSPFFNKIGVKFGTNELVLPSKNLRIIAVSAGSADALGRNVFGGVIDEADFLKGSTISSKMAATKGGNKPFVEQLHESIMKRMKSRFDRSGVLPGKLILASSAKNRDAFTNRRIGEAANDSTVFCRDYALYEALPARRFSKKRFWVLVGNERINHKILTDYEYDEMGDAGRQHLRGDGCMFLHVPDNFRSDFERNIEDSIRDIGGVVTVTLSPYIQMRGRIYDAIDPTLKHPMPRDTWITGTPLNINWGQISHKVRRRVGVGLWEESVEPIRHPEAMRHVHIDLSLGKTDAAGLCIAHTAGVVEVERRDQENLSVVVEEAPIIEVDLILRIEAPPNSEIDIGAVRSIVYAFMDHGFSFNFASLDSFQSAESIQKFRQQGIRADKISVDSTTEPYDYTKLALYEGRLVYYKYPILTGELKDLQLDISGVKPKVVHLPGGAKDCADSLGGVTYSLSTKLDHGARVFIEKSEYEKKEDGSRWIRETMYRKGKEPPIKVGDTPSSGGPLIFTG